jgi:hypothetical protein
MFGLRNQFWTNLSSTAGKVITGFNSTFTNALTVNWGDGTTTPLTSGVNVNKTLGTTNAIELETNNAVVTQINCGTSSPRLGGTVDISAFPNLQQFRCNSNDITALSGYAQNSNLTLVNFTDNKVTETIPSLSALTNMLDFNCAGNLLTGTIPNLNALSGLQSFVCSSNGLSGPLPNLNSNTDLRSFGCADQFGTGAGITGPIPNLDNNTALRNFFCHNNKLTGSIPNLSENKLLINFFCFANQLTGSIPNLSANTELSVFRCGIQTLSNKLTGSIPNLSNNNKLTWFECNVNQLTGFAGGSVSNTLGNFQAQDNQLTATAVNAILAAFVAANKTTGTRILNLGGGGNAAPTGQGLIDKQTLLDRGWRTATGLTTITN